MVYNYIGDDENIMIISNLLYADLIAHYKSAKALLIPLRNTIQDTARFPHKISEYTASQAVIISTNYGEIQYYFNDGLNAIISDKYSIKMFSAKIDWVLDNENSLKSIKERSYSLGNKYFNYISYYDDVEAFLLKIVKISH